MARIAGAELVAQLSALSAQHGCRVILWPLLAGATTTININDWQAPVSMLAFSPQTLH